MKMIGTHEASKRYGKALYYSLSIPADDEQYSIKKYRYIMLLFLGTEYQEQYTNNYIQELISYLTWRK